MVGLCPDRLLGDSTRLLDGELTSGGVGPGQSFGLYAGGVKVQGRIERNKIERRTKGDAQALIKVLLERPE